jgi:hypothetical protein
MAVVLRLRSPLPEEPSILDRVNAPLAPGIASGEPPGCEDHPAGRPHLPDRVDRILRAGGVVLAARGKGWGDHPAIDSDRKKHERRQGAPKRSGTARAALPGFAPFHVKRLKL